MNGETVTVVRAGSSTDPYSLETVTDWTSPTETDLPGCAFDPGTASEPASNWRLTFSATPTLYAPPGADITKRDRVIVRGLLYEVSGEPADWRSPWTGQQMGLVVALSKFG